MEMYQDELRKQVPAWLIKLAIKANYVISPAHGLQGFLEGFEKNGIAVVRYNKKKKADFVGTVTLDRDTFSVDASLLFDNIWTGWKKHPFSCVSNYHQAVDDIFHAFGISFLDRDSSRFLNTTRREMWLKERGQTEGKVVRDIHHFWLNYFNEYQENMLIPTTGVVPELTKPTLFERVSENFDWDVYRNAVDLEMRSEKPKTPESRDLPSTPASRFNNGFHPNVSQMQDYFWAVYMEKLAEEKGYVSDYSGHKDYLAHLITGKESAFRSGESLKWERFS